jgi:hypothetical protein
MITGQRICRRAGSRESIQSAVRQRSKARSLRTNPSPPRITQESYRLRVSDRTVVACCKPRLLVTVSGPSRVSMPIIGAFER